MDLLHGPFNTEQYDTINMTSDMLRLLPITGAAELSSVLRRLSQTRTPSASDISSAHQLCHTVSNALMAETSPDRWLDEVSCYSPTEQTELISDLINQRLVQSNQIKKVLNIVKAIPATKPNTLATFV